MIYKLFLEPEQVKEIAIQIRGRKMVEDLIARCEQEEIASRRTVFVAIDYETYMATSNKHRGVTETALKMLEEEGFTLDTTQKTEPELAEA